MDDRIARVARAFRVGLPPAVWPVFGIGEASVRAALASGWLVEEDGRHRPNPLATADVTPIAAGEAGRALLAWLDDADDPDPDLWLEAARLVPKARKAHALRRAVAAACAGGTAERLARGVVDGRLDECLAVDRTATLRLLVEGGLHKDVAAYVEDPGLRARARLAAGDLVGATEPEATGEAALVAARAWLDRGDPVRADAALARAGTPDDETLADERCVLEVRVASHRGDDARTEAALAALDARAEATRRHRLRVHGLMARVSRALRWGDVREADRHMVVLHPLAVRIGGERALAAADWYDAVLGLYGGNDARVAAGLRRPRRFALGDGHYWSRVEVGAALMRGDDEAAAALASKLLAASVFGAENYLATLSLWRGDPERALALLGASAAPAQNEEIELLRRIARRLRGDPDEGAFTPRGAYVQGGAWLLAAERRLDAGDLAGAEQLANQVVAHLERYGLLAMLPDAWLVVADARARARDAAGAAAALDRAETRLPHPDAPAARRLAAARAAIGGTALPDARIALFARAGDVFALGPLYRDREAPPAVRAALDAAHPHARRLAEAAFPAIADPDAVLVAADGAWFRRGDARTDLARRVALKRLLACLAAARTAQPDVAVSLDALSAAGWPGERIVASAAADRVYVAIATLRRMGLRQDLVSADGGYRLARRVRIAQSG